MRKAIIRYGFSIPYHWLVDNTTDRYWTYIMRDNPWYLYVPGWAGTGVVIYVLTAIYHVPWYVSVATTGFSLLYGLMSGHVRWGKKNPKVEQDHSEH